MYETYKGRTTMKESRLAEVEWQDNWFCEQRNI